MAPEQNSKIVEPLNTKRRLYLRVVVKLMAGSLLLAIVVLLLASLLAPRDKLDGVEVHSLIGLKWGEAKHLQWQGKKLWLVKRRKDQVLALRDMDKLVKDPWSKSKPLPKGVNYLHRGLLQEYLLVFAQGEACEVEFLKEEGREGFYEPCADYRYDLAGRLLSESDASGIAEHLRIPDYRIVGAQLIIGDEPE